MTTTTPSPQRAPSADPAFSGPSHPPNCAKQATQPQFTARSGRSLVIPQSLDTLMSMVSYAELCQAIERWQRSQGRVTALESALQQAMWRGFIQHHAPDVHMEFQGDALDPNLADSHPNYPIEGDEALIEDIGSVHESYPEEIPYAATGS